MSEPGPTGDVGPTGDAPEQTGPSEATGPSGPTGPDIMTLFPNAATGPVEPPNIATLDELMASHAVIVAKEAADKVLLDPFINPVRDQYRPQLFQWAAAGFPGIYVVQSITLTPPELCADGNRRDLNAYIGYLMGTDMGTVVANIQALVTGIIVSYSYEPTRVLIHVSKA